jgi:predicted metal-dependent peptidase
LVEQIDSALRQGALAAQKVGNGSELDLGQLLAPKVDWKAALREFISATCAGNDYATWSRPNRRYIGAGMYMPSGVSQQVEELVVGVDTSGSIGGTALREFLSEVSGICEQVKPARLRLLYWDEKVRREELYSVDAQGTLASSTKPAGGGGTDASCVPDYLREKNIKPQAVVMLTDGYVYSWGQWDVPVLWCVIGSKRVPPMGRVVHV